MHGLMSCLHLYASVFADAELFGHLHEVEFRRSVIEVVYMEEADRVGVERVCKSHQCSSLFDTYSVLVREPE